MGTLLHYRIRKTLGARRVNASWGVDETAVSVRGGRHYLYRAVDKHGEYVESLLCAERDMKAAQAFFRKAVSTHHRRWPRSRQSLRQLWAQALA